MAPEPSASDPGQSSSPLDLGSFEEPDDQGLSLDELSRAYEVLLKKGADPYQDRGSEVAAHGPAAEEQDEDSGDDRPRGEDPCPITPKSILEAMLFVGHPANEPLASERIAALMRGVTPGEIDDLVDELNSQYEAEKCPYSIVSVELGYCLTLRPEFHALRDAFYRRVREARLSQSAIDVLAIVAYQQPITQQQIDRLRGKPSGSIVSQLVRRDLLALQWPPEPKSKPLLRTTDRFLDLFDLDQVSDLPRSHDLDRNL
jgi:segregation and condensation protein B